MPEKRILLVEDERELRELLAIGLRRAGYTVDVAATADEARQHMEAQSYALVIVDWLLPDGNGIDLADRALGHQAKTLIVSGYSFGRTGWRGGRYSCSHDLLIGNSSVKRAGIVPAPP